MHIFLLLQALRLVSAQHGYMPEVQWVWRGFWPLNGSCVEKATQWLTSLSKAAWSTFMKTSLSPRGALGSCPTKESSTGVKITDVYRVYFEVYFCKYACGASSSSVHLVCICRKLDQTEAPFPDQQSSWLYEPVPKPVSELLGDDNTRFLKHKHSWTYPAFSQIIYKQQKEGQSPSCDFFF